MARDLDNREIARLVVTGVLAIVLVGLVVDNTRKVKIGYVFGDAQMPLIVLLLITAALGAAVAQLVAWRRHH